MKTIGRRWITTVPLVWIAVIDSEGSLEMKFEFALGVSNDNTNTITWLVITKETAAILIEKVHVDTALTKSL